CLESKRECIFKTGPRTRRPRQPNKRLNQPTASSGLSTGSAAAAPAAAAAAARAAAANAAYPPPPGPSKTFTIDIPMPAEDDITDSLEALRLAHDQAIDLLVPLGSAGEEEEEEDEDEDDEDRDRDRDQASVSGAGSVLSNASSLPVGASALSTPPSSVAVPGLQPPPGLEGQGRAVQGEAGRGARPRTLASLRLQPRFNLDSAGKLLETFREHMLSYFHCVVIGEGETVASMARERPFVLLAVLAAASASRTLQGHSLYDEEFRKVLGLKFVAGGERTLELLQGLLIYNGWYPFHLRPKNKQSRQYLRMVVDIVSDLELDQDPGIDLMDVPPTPERLDQIRLYIASYYMVSVSASSWGNASSLTYTDYTGLCCDLLHRHSPHQGDRVLAWQVRLQRLVEDTNDLRRTHRGRSQSEYQIGLMIRGMETQLAEWEARIEPAVAANASIRLAVLFTRVFLSGAPLLHLSWVRAHQAATSANPSLSATASFRPDPQRLMAAIPSLHALYDFFLTLSKTQINSLTGVEWRILILSVILGFRMSFPLAACPEWDDRAAREAVRFGEYMDRLCRMGGGEDVSEIRSSATTTTAAAAAGGGATGEQSVRSIDVLSASKIVLEMVKSKYRERAARLERKQQQQQKELEAMLAAAAPHPMPAGEGRGGGALGHGFVPTACPVMDGSLDSYYPYWDETFNSNLAGTGLGMMQAHGTGTAQLDGGDVALAGDLWTAMTMGWAQG
ncbi:hypothetical protein L209DRAFT_649591, partial [Thermothelomyces heterothallicus CBS 203.75]